MIMAAGSNTQGAAAASPSVCDVEDFMSCSSKSGDVESLCKNLLEWYRTKRRKLPWRGDDDDLSLTSYGTWVSGYAPADSGSYCSVVLSKVDGAISYC